MNKAALAVASLWCVLLAGPVSAQSLHLVTVATDIEAPLGFVQDPSQPNVQFILTQGGRIRIIKDGALLDQDFLDLTSIVGHDGFGGLMGMAMAPDYAVSGRFYVNFVSPEIHSVIARFVRSAGDPLVADPNSRFDLVFPDGEGGTLPYIVQPYGDHNGGDLAFGSDGYLYIALGDGGSENDPEHRAQDPNTLLGKVLRLDVSVADDDAEGYDVPDSNPFVGQDGILPEIWAFGLRNPWRYTFDDPARGGTGALIIGDVGQDAIEEIDYEPAGAGGRNYGWRNFEGTRENITDLPLFSDPTFPIYEYDHDVGKTVIAGYVYRGSALPASFVGRLFFGDFITQRVWSMELNVDPGTGEATAGTVYEHTIELGDRFGMITSFGMDAAGELYLVSYSTGCVYRIEAGSADPHPILHFDPPPAVLSQPFQLTGWAIDTGAFSSTGIDYVHVWALPNQGPPVFLGASYGQTRADIALQYGAQFMHAGFTTSVHDLPVGAVTFVAYGHNEFTQQFSVVDVLQLVIPPSVDMRLEIESPGNMSTVPGIVTLTGWSIDPASLTGSGTDLLHVWAVDANNVAQFLGWTKCTIDRPDVASQYGSHFLTSGWTLTATDLHPGRWTFIVYAHSSVTNTFRAAATISLDVTDFQAGMRLMIESPSDGETLSNGPHVLRGWSWDLGAAPGTSGVDTVHVWAVPLDGAPAILLGASTMGIARPDIAADFGSQFDDCGFERSFDLPPGEYTLIAYAFRTRTQTFEAAAIVSIVIQAP